MKQVATKQINLKTKQIDRTLLTIEGIYVKIPLETIEIIETIIKRYNCPRSAAVDYCIRFAKENDNEKI